MDAVTAQIAEHAAGLCFTQLDRRTIEAATLRLVDSIACAIGARDCEPAAMARRLSAGERPGKRAGRVLCHGDRITAEAAAFINTAMIRNFDFNDRYPGGHPSDGLGALLALAGATPEPTAGSRLLTAMVVLYEVFARLSDAARLSRRGWDQGHAIAVATAAGTGNLLGLPRASIASAVGIACASVVPLRVTRSGELTPWKNAATAFAARSGLAAALLAGEGMVGPLNAFAGRDGLFEKVSGPFELAPFPGAGGPCLTPRVQIKYWPVETNAQPVIWAGLELRERLTTADVASIEQIEVLTTKFTWFEIGSEPEKWDPQTRETADHSLPYILARTLVDGPITVASFDEPAVRDPALRQLMGRIKVTVDPAIEAQLPRVMLRVHVRLGGRLETVEVVDPLGHPDNPMQAADVCNKLLALARPVIGEARGRAIYASWMAVAAADDVGGLMGMLEGPDRTGAAAPERF